MKKFDTEHNGYNKEQVNSFVSNVTSEYENILNKLKNQEKEIELLNSKLNHYKNLESTLNRAVLVAEDSSNQIKRVAKDEANSIIEQAKKNANHIVNDALLKAEKVEIDADNLRRSLKVYKERIRSAISQELELVKDLDNIDIKDY